MKPEQKQTLKQIYNELPDLQSAIHFAFSSRDPNLELKAHNVLNTQLSNLNLLISHFLKYP